MKIDFLNFNTIKTVNIAITITDTVLNPKIVNTPAAAIKTLKIIFLIDIASSSSSSSCEPF